MPPIFTTWTRWYGRTEVGAGRRRQRHVEVLDIGLRYRRGPREHGDRHDLLPYAARKVYSVPKLPPWLNRACEIPLTEQLLTGRLSTPADF